MVDISTWLRKSSTRKIFLVDTHSRSDKGLRRQVLTAPNQLLVNQKLYFIFPVYFSYMVGISLVWLFAGNYEHIEYEFIHHEHIEHEHVHHEHIEQNDLNKPVVKVPSTSLLPPSTSPLPGRHHHRCCCCTFPSQFWSHILIIGRTNKFNPTLWLIVQTKKTKKSPFIRCKLKNERQQAGWQPKHGQTNIIAS